MGDMSKAAERRKAPLQTPSIYDSNAIRDLSGALNALLADTFAIYLKTKNFHWHMSGPHFRDYHLLLDEQGDQIFAMTDPMAERVRKIGGITLHSIGEIARLQRVEDNDARLCDAAGHARRSCATTTRISSAACARRTISATSTGTSPPPACIENWIDETERRVWFLFEATRDRNISP